ncbi:MAG TPA: choice-of-anchor Q domain-containing protein, partial [Acidimicrobiales bacterium]|nr:choice-of-anchor Q domain-containing protein [Acidimicrobiales bacterium]
VVNVPADQPTIQAGIDAAVAGDTVVVAPGTYHEHIDFKGKAIEVRSASGPATTTIDGDNTNTVVVFHSSETRASVLRGFTITHGLVAHDQPLAFAGGGIGIDGSSPTIVGNVVTANAAGGHSGAGIGALFGAALIQDNQIVGNDAGQYGAGGGIFAGDAVEIAGNLIEDNSAGGGAGILIFGGTPTVRDNVIRGNTAAAFNGGGLNIGGANIGGGGVYVDNLVVGNTADVLGGGVWLHDTGTTNPPSLLNNTIVGNQAPTGSAIGGDNAAATIVDNVVVGPSADSLVSCTGTAVSGAAFSYNDLYNATASPVAGCADPTGTSGNVAVDPRFVASAASPADYHLQPGSPAIDAGDPAPATLPPADFGGAPRITDGNGDGIPVVDMGAYEAAGTAVIGERFHPLVPARILDTRFGVGAPAAKLGPAATLTLPVTGHGGIPATGVSAVVLNVTVTQPTAPSFLTAWPTGVPLPLAANLNFLAGQTVPNLVTVKVGDGGSVNLYNAAGSTDIVADVAGWYGAGGSTSGARYTSVLPARILDTRLGVGAPAAMVGPGSTLTLPVTGHGGIPATGVSAVVLNVTVTQPTAPSFLTAWPAGVPLPLAANLNFLPGQTVPNLVVVKVGDGGAINLYNAAGSTHIVADVAGWFGDDGGPGGSGYTSVLPARILDTRFGVGAPAAMVGPGSTLTLPVTGHGGIPAAGVSAVVLNVTVTQPTAPSFLTAWPAGVPLPLAANLNFLPGQTVPNLVVVKVGAGGAVNLYNAAGATHIVADVAGWYSG